MKPNKDLVLLILTIATFLLSGCGAGAPGQADEIDVPIPQSEQKKPPEEFASLKNPYENQTEAIAEGEILFQADCSSCHGSGGQGDGPASAGLNPAPKNLAQNQADLEDGYLYWRIAEGGLMEPFNSVMPAWKGLLDEEKIWQIVTYIRTLD